MEDISFWIWTAAAFIAIGFLICRLAYVAFGLAFDYVWEQQALRKLLRRSRKIDLSLPVQRARLKSHRNRLQLRHGCYRDVGQG